MSVVIKLLGLASGQACPEAGQYLRSFDVEAHEGRGEVACTPELASAMRFDHAGHAHAFWRQASQCYPVRPDGHPNRPLTAFTIGIYDPEKAAELEGRPC